MTNRIKTSDFCKIIYVMVIVAVLLGIWPTGLIHRTSVNKTSEHASIVTPAEIEDCSLASQPFVTDGTRLKYIDLMLTEATAGDQYDFEMFDEKAHSICHVIRKIPDDFKTPGMIRIPTAVNVTRGGFYTYTIKGIDSEIFLGYEEHMNTSNPFCFASVYDGVELEQYNTYASYHYGVSFNTWQNTVIYIILALVAFGGCRLISYCFFKGTAKEKEYSVLRMERVLGTLIIVLLSAILLYMVFPGKVFGTFVSDYIFYDAGITILALYLLCVLWSNHSGIGLIPTGKSIQKNISRWLQPICFAGALWQCYEYWNGLYDIFHEYAVRKMLCWFILAIIVTFSRKELFNLINLAYLIVSAIFGYFYVSPHIGVQDEDLLFKLNAQIIILGGIAIVGIIRGLVDGIRNHRLNRVRKSYLVFTILLFLGMSIFRNGNVWVTVTWVMLLMLTLRMLSWRDFSSLSMNICHGVICNYVFTVGYCLIHRPYRAFYFYRYGMLYHTVTVTAEYLTLVIAVALVLFIRRFHAISVNNEHVDKNSKLLLFTAMWKEVLLLGSALSYMIFTLSRTGFVAIVAMLIVLLAIYVIGMRTGMKAIIDSFRIFVFAILSGIILFATTFSFTRIVPALVNEPVCSDIELDGWQVEEGTAPDDERYINLDRFIYCAREKLFGISDENGKEQEIEEKELAFENMARDMMLLTDETTTGDVEQASEGIEQFSNGRIDLFKRYIAAWNLTGHDEMGVPMADGELAVHAHNSFLQAIHDFGLIAGLYVVIFGICTLIYGVVVFRKVSGKDMYALMTPAIVVGFTAAGMTEWMFHICNPVGWTLFMCVVPLLFGDRAES